MARSRFKGFARRARSAAMRVGRRVRRGSSNKNPGFKNFLVAVALYAKARPYLVGYTKPYTSKLTMLKGYDTEVVHGGVGALAAWKGKGYVKTAGQAVAASELFIGLSKSNTASGAIGPEGATLYL